MIIVRDIDRDIARDIVRDFWPQENPGQNGSHTGHHGQHNYQSVSKMFDGLVDMVHNRHANALLATFSDRKGVRLPFDRSPESDYISDLRSDKLK